MAEKDLIDCYNVGAIDQTNKSMPLNDFQIAHAYYSFIFSFTVLFYLIISCNIDMCHQFLSRHEHWMGNQAKYLKLWLKKANDTKNVILM